MSNNTNNKAIGMPMIGQEYPIKMRNVPSGSSYGDQVDNTASTNTVNDTLDGRVMTSTASLQKGTYVAPGMHSSYNL